MVDLASPSITGFSPVRLIHIILTHLPNTEHKHCITDTCLQASIVSLKVAYKITLDEYLGEIH
ncbi:hypothetical protein [Orientia tsutsugamushi]|uniref:hypothetical protein n=1 Tax=Orientia tsutsugamushi TaxID=784 RepID=UPI0005F95825|nr:hypothetical protein [Orientia tsutsugamushi]KJV56848.1 hypothetical protein OTSKATO_0157 [Orientia tsutsugamushi str. Kato PP]